MDPGGTVVHPSLARLSHSRASTSAQHSQKQNHRRLDCLSIVSVCFNSSRREKNNNPLVSLKAFYSDVNVCVLALQTEKRPTRVSHPPSNRNVPLSPYWTLAEPEWQADSVSTNSFQEAASLHSTHSFHIFSGLLLAKKVPTFSVLHLSHDYIFKISSSNVRKHLVRRVPLSNTTCNSK